MHSADRIVVPTSLTLLARLRNRESDGWRDFLNLYAPLVVRWCSRQGLTDSDTADVAQVVFSNVAEHIDTFRKASSADSLRGWLCRITHHAIIDLVRQRRRPGTAEGGTDAMRRLTTLTEAAEPNEEEVADETRYLFGQAVKIAQSEFTERMWQMFWRVTVDGNSATAVAEEFGATPAAVRQIKSRILRRLREVVGDVAE